MFITKNHLVHEKQKQLIKKSCVFLVFTASKGGGESRAVRWFHPTVEIIQEKEKRKAEERIRWSNWGPSDLDTWTVQIQSAGERSVKTLGDRFAM